MRYKAGGGFGLIHSHPEIYEEGAKALVTNGWGTNGFYSSCKGPASCPYRSQLELDYMELLDSDPQILSWLYEPFSIDYSNADGFPRLYYPDFLIEYEDRKEVHEVKPSKLVSEINNQLKFEAAMRYCELNDLQFKVITENEIYSSSRNEESI